MIHAVLDTNTLASGAIAPAGGTLASVTDAWQGGRFGVVLSAPILDELARVLATTYFSRRLSATDISAYRELVHATAEIVELTAHVSGVATHPEDDLVLATALSGGATHVVTGDRALQRLREHHGITILSAREFVVVLLAAE